MTISNDKIILDQVLEQNRQLVASALTPNEYFEIFSAEQILKDFDLSYEEIRSGIVGQGGDGGIDGIYIFINGEILQEDTDVSVYKRNVSLEIVIIQSKVSPSFSESAIDKLVAVTEDLFDLSRPLKDFTTVYNKDLLGVIDKFRKAHDGLAARFPRLKFSYYYASKGSEVSPNVQRKVQRLEERIRLLFSSSDFEFKFLGARELLLMARRSPSTTHTLILAENPISSSGAVGFICLVRLQDYHSFITDDNGHIRRDIFEANVRDYQGLTEINEQIQETLRGTFIEDFWWLNNGVTIIASKATQSGKTLSVENPEIVNGLQSSTEVYNYFKSINQSVDNRNILIRVIVPAKPESRDRIIKATNSQTPIPPASLRSTDKIHRDIEEILKPHGLYYDRRKNYYKNEGKSIDRIISIPFMAQSIMAIALQRPDDARARPSSLMKKNEDYNRLFNPRFPIKMYLFCASLMRFIEERLRADDLRLEKKDRNNVKYHIGMYIPALYLKKQQPTVDDLSQMSVSDIDEGTINMAIRQVQIIYEILGTSDQVSKGPEFLREVKQDLAEQISLST